MKRTDKLVLGAVIPPFVIALTVLTFVVFVRELGRLSELFISRNASFGVVAGIAGAIVPGILVFSLPLSFLIGCLIGLSGLSGESQITALLSCGIPLRRLLRGLLALGTLVALATGAFSLYVLPRTNDILEELKHRINLRQLTSQVQPRVFNEDFPNIVFYLDDLSVGRRFWSRVFVADNSDPRNPNRIILAREGSWVGDPSGTMLQLHLVDGRIYQVDPLDETRDNVSRFVSIDIPIPLDLGERSQAGRERSRGPKRPFETTTGDLWRGAPGTTPEQRRAELIELHRRIALPCSAFAFALLALPLGASTKRTGRSAGFVLSLLLVLLYYSMLWSGSNLASVGTIPPWLGPWGGNIVLAMLGGVLMLSGERGRRFRHGLYDWKNRKAKESAPAAAKPAAALRRVRACLDLGVIGGGSRAARRCLPKILDFYVARGFLVYFAWSAVACATLFVALTLFELLDDIVRNRIPPVVVADYFFSLTPQILLFVVPMAVLLATLIHFGIMEKASEITAIKAGGWSLYRVSLPVIVLSAVVCAGLYLLQDYVLPYANMRQDSLRNMIKGRPARTLRPQRKWIIGEDGRIFNYDYFDSAQDVFVKLNIYEVDLEELQILRKIRAARATVDRAGRWILEDGWIHDFRPGRPGFERIQQARFDFPEGASYFKKDIFEPKESSKLTYLQLKEYIEYLSKSGYNATELKVELHKKASFPLSALVMSLLGVPFSFFMGRRGAFFGIGASVVIAIIFWGVFGVFEQMGSYGLLAPALAAWAPDVLFGATGLLLLLNLRT